MILAALLLLGASRPAPTPGWLAGLWIPVSDAVREDRDACASDEAKRYRADGRFADFWMAGEWRLRGSRLYETVTQMNDPADLPYPEHGRTVVSRVERLGRDRVRLTDAESGEETLLLRCREAP